MKAFRADLVIATMALLVSGGATLSSLYQTHVIANQLSSSVWPYLSVVGTTSPDSFELAISNDGLGPALIRSATLSIDAKAVPSYRAALARLTAGLQHPLPPFRGSYSSIGPTTVIRAGDSHRLVLASGAVIPRLGDLGKRVSLELCYCSLLDQCWDQRQSEPRRAVASCDAHGSVDF